MPSESEPPVSPPALPWWRRLWQNQGGNLKLLMLAVVLAVTVRLFIAEPRYIPSNSMEPTLVVGDRLLVDKVSYRWHPPRRGDVVVFRPPPQLSSYGYSPNQAFIKRVVGLSGDTLQTALGQLYRDGQPLAEPYILEPPTYEMPPRQVSEGNLFVMGDNRNDSNDSHVWGELPQENIIGQARFRFWPLSRFGPLPPGRQQG